ncbi:MAG: hypothetical protein ACPLRM_02930, partial [Anaerolineae bacterium]
MLHIQWGKLTICVLLVLILGIAGIPGSAVGSVKAPNIDSIPNPFGLTPEQSNGYLNKSDAKIPQLIEHPEERSITGPIPPQTVFPPAEQTPDVLAASTMIDGVPAYLWRHGCGPTAVGMVIGYYDSHGFPDLIPGDAGTQTEIVNQSIASQGSDTNPQHYEDYSLPLDDATPTILPDRSEDPPGDEHPNNCIADWLCTSWSVIGLRYGWSYGSLIGASFVDYVTWRNPTYSAQSSSYRWSEGTLTWSLVTGEIAANRPMVFLVDTDGNGSTDHFVTVIGTRDIN